MKHKIALFATSLILLTVLAPIALLVGRTYADPATASVTCADGSTATAKRAGAQFTDADYQAACKSIGTTYQAPRAAGSTAGQAVCPSNWVKLKADDRVCCPPGSGGTARDCIFAKYINPTIKALSGLAAVAAVIGIIMGGIQYAASGGDPQKAAQGKGKIIKALYGLIAFLFLYSALNFLSPGGISSTGASVGPPGIAGKCSKPFLGLKPWFAYLPDTAFEDPTGGYSCELSGFQLFGNDQTGSQLMPIFLVVADNLVRIAGLVAVAFVIVGGVKFVTSNGEPERTKQARETIINALIGLAMAILAAAIVEFIGGKLTQ